MYIRFNYMRLSWQSHKILFFFFTVFIVPSSTYEIWSPLVEEPSLILILFLTVFIVPVELMIIKSQAWTLLGDHPCVIYASQLLYIEVSILNSISSSTDISILAKSCSVQSFQNGHTKAPLHCSLLFPLIPSLRFPILYIKLAASLIFSIKTKHF